MREKTLKFIVGLFFIVCTSQFTVAQCNSCGGGPDLSVAATCGIACGSQTGCGGPGTEMTKMINRLGLGSDCWRCKQLAAEMDANGPEWVCANFDCVVSRTVENARRLGHRMGPVQQAGVRMLVRKAVRRSR